MSGIYIHIPFCKSRCIYCDFYSTTGSRNRNLYVERVLDEARARKDFFGSTTSAKGVSLPSEEGNSMLSDKEPSIPSHHDNPSLSDKGPSAPFDKVSTSQEPSVPNKIRTVYIGGGTPSQLPATALARLVEGLAGIFDLSEVEEFTLEANPEDITPDFVRALPREINRVSMGVQSFVDAELTLLRRRHNAQRAKDAVRLLQDAAGVRNISIDLMYGLPQQTEASLDYSIGCALSLDIQHISAYNLSVEPGTELARRVGDGSLCVADDDLCLAMNTLLRRRLQKAGFRQYEISNYALPGFESKHNSSYWTRTPYLGLGPGAHSYDGRRLRCWNEPDLGAYLRGERPCGSETLTDTDLYNEQIMLGLRTAHGAVLDESPVLASLITRGLLTRNTQESPSRGHLYRLTEEGLALADEVIRELMR